jgi:hypothetical protein
MSAGILYTAELILKAKTYTTQTTKLNGFSVGKFDGGFTVIEELGGKTIKRDGLLLAPELQSNGHSYNIDLILPTLWPKNYSATVLGKDVQLQSNIQTIADSEIMGGSTDGYGAGAIFDTKGGNSPLGRPVLELFFDGNAVIYSGGVIEAEGKLLDVLKTPLEAGVHGRTGEVNVVKAYLSGKTDDWMTGQLRTILESDKIDKMSFDDGVVISLGKMKGVLTEADNELKLLRGKNRSALN